MVQSILKSLTPDTPPPVMIQKKAPPPIALTKDPIMELEGPEGLAASQIRAAQLGLNAFLRPLLTMPKK